MWLHDWEAESRRWWRDYLRKMFPQVHQGGLDSLVGLLFDANPPVGDRLWHTLLMILDTSQDVHKFIAECWPAKLPQYIRWLDGTKRQGKR
jgi:hypothetical protein